VQGEHITMGSLHQNGQRSSFHRKQSFSLVAILPHYVY